MSSLSDASIFVVMIIAIGSVFFFMIVYPVFLETAAGREYCEEKGLQREYIEGNTYCVSEKDNKQTIEFQILTRCKKTGSDFVIDVLNYCANGHEIIERGNRI